MKPTSWDTFGWQVCHSSAHEFLNTSFEVQETSWGRATYNSGRDFSGLAVAGNMLVLYRPPGLFKPTSDVSENDWCLSTRDDFIMQIQATAERSTKVEEAKKFGLQGYFKLGNQQLEINGVAKQLTIENGCLMVGELNYSYVRETVTTLEDQREKADKIAQRAAYDLSEVTRRAKHEESKTSAKFAYKPAVYKYTNTGLKTEKGRTIAFLDQQNGARQNAFLTSPEATLLFDAVAAKKEELTKKAIEDLGDKKFGLDRKSSLPTKPWLKGQPSLMAAGAKIAQRLLSNEELAVE